MFDPRTTKDELVYYATKDSKFPRGRVSLAECTIGQDDDQMEVWSKAEAATQTTLLLVRPGKGPLLIKSAFPEEISLLAALIQRRHAPEPPAPLPAEETSPEVPASHAASELLTSAMQTRTTSHDADPRGRTERRMERTQQTERVISRSSDWSAQVAEELEPPTLSHSSSSRSTGLRQSQADSFRAVVESLGSKLAYRKAMDLMWNYDLEAASVLLAPWQSSNLWHASGAAECFMLRTILTGRKSDALSTLELIKVAEALSEGVGSTGSTLAHEVCNAELLLMRSLLQIILGFRFRALYNLRQCWYAYYRLEQFLEDDASMRACTEDVDCVMTYDDLRGRILFGLGFFYMATSLVPTSLVPLVRLAGFLMHRQRGKTYLFECVERALGSRCSIAAILLAMYHLDLEPDMKHAGNILIASLGRQPENTLLHWAGSLLAWRNTFVSQAVSITGKALWCCGEELGEKAVYLRYELGMFHFISMDWTKAHEHLNCVYISVNSDKVFFPYRTLVTTQLAAVAFSLGEHEHGESLCKECAATQDWSGLLKLETDFAKVMQIFLRRRRHGRQMLAFEVMYFLRQFPKVPSHMLLAIKDNVRKAVAPKESEENGSCDDECRSVELASALTIQVVICFYLGDAAAAMVFVPELSELCPRLPSWATYISVHGLYWCGRVLALNQRDREAHSCLHLARSYKKYPFNIAVKISKVLAEHEEHMAKEDAAL
ncbi:Tetratricopeptide repeat protein 39B (TPR repeat protein 39B) [Durusdinium trenchii]|uniref:Tetratricopeptide repeat protein 39B (TPR repeat protein 39B) n=1 Tax=Durusdinium trenchii TaxID=1381693 RepID=A0ABP0QB62_9DINO